MARDKNLLCRQTVTIYHGENGAVRRTALAGVYCQGAERATPSAEGTRDGTMLLLVIPAAAGTLGTDYTLAPGDRVCEGEGPALTWAEWSACPDTLAAVEYVTPYTLAGKPHHVEAGAWWTGSGTGAHSLTR